MKMREATQSLEYVNTLHYEYAGLAGTADRMEKKIYIRTPSNDFTKADATSQKDVDSTIYKCANQHQARDFAFNTTARITRWQGQYDTHFETNNGTNRNKPWLALTNILKVKTKRTNPRCPVEKKEKKKQGFETLFPSTTGNQPPRRGKITETLLVNSPASSATINITSFIFPNTQGSNSHKAY